MAINKVDGTISGKITSRLPTISGKLSIAPVEGEQYQGDYIVNPKFVEQVLETKGKSMKDNVTVLEIEVNKVTNLGGGYTVIIGG